MTQVPLDSQDHCDSMEATRRPHGTPTTRHLPAFKIRRAGPASHAAVAVTQGIRDGALGGRDDGWVPATERLRVKEMSPCQRQHRRTVRARAAEPKPRRELGDAENAASRPWQSSYE